MPRRTGADSARPPAEFWMRPDVSAALEARDMSALFSMLRASGVSRLRLAMTVGLSETRVDEHVTRYESVGHYFYVLAGGNAVNFLHGASVGTFIFLVQAEILAALSRLTAGDIEPGYHEVADADRRYIAETWLTHFNRSGSHS